MEEGKRERKEERDEEGGERRKGESIQAAMET